MTTSDTAPPSGQGPSADERALARVKEWQRSLSAVDMEILNRLSAGQQPKEMLDEIGISYAALFRKIDSWKDSLRLKTQAQVHALWLRIRPQASAEQSLEHGDPTIMQMFQRLPGDDEALSPATETRPPSDGRAPAATTVLLSPVLLAAAQTFTLDEITARSSSLVAQHSAFLALVPALTSGIGSQGVRPAIDGSCLARWVLQNELLWLPMVLTLRWRGLIPHVDRLPEEQAYEADWGKAFRAKYKMDSCQDIEVRDYLCWENYRSNIIHGSYPPCIRDEIYRYNVALGSLAGMMTGLFQSMSSNRFEMSDNFNPAAASWYCCQERTKAFRHRGIDANRFWTFIVMSANGLPTEPYSTLR